MRRVQSKAGFTLIELVMAVTVLSILSMGVIPLVKMSVRRQKEQQLRESLRTMRAAIDQFHREALAGAAMVQPGGTLPSGTLPSGTLPAGGGGLPGQPPPLDPRIRVGITDNTIFTVDNIDRYPPDLDTLVSGVNVTPLLTSIVPSTTGNPTDNATVSTKKKIYLREVPIDPMTGKKDWVVRSCYDSPDSTSTSGENVFDVRSKSTATALNGEKYSDW